MPKYYQRKRRRYGNKKGFVKRKPANKWNKYAKWAGAAITGAGALWKTVNYLKSVINVENKCEDLVTAGPIAIPYHPNGASFSDVNAKIIIGDGANERNGNSIKNNGYSMRADFDINPAGANVQRIKLVFVNYMTNSNLEPSKSQLWDDVNTFDPRRNIEYTKNYRVLRVITVVLDKDNYRHKTINVSIPTHWHTKYSSTANADYTDVSSGLFQWIVWSDVNANAPTMSNINQRFRYIDN